MPDAVAYIIYLTKSRTLTYPETEAYSEPFQIFTIVIAIQNSMQRLHIRNSRHILNPVKYPRCGFFC